MNIFKSIIIIVLLTICFSSAFVIAQEDALIHQYKFDGNLDDAVGDSNGVFADGWYLLPEIDNFIDGHDGTPQGALNFPAADGGGFMIYVGRWSAVKEGVDGEMTLTLWGLWYGRYDDGTQDIINKRDDYQPEGMMWGFNNPGPDGNDSLAVKRRGASANFPAGFDIDVWTHIAITMDGINATLYKNGEEIASLPYEYGTKYDARIHMGSAGNSDGSYRDVDAYNGALDDVRFYSRVLTAQEIKTVYEGGGAVDVEENSSSLPIKFELTQNYPNPFNPTTTIHYELPESGNYSLKVYNLLGQEVATLCNGNVSAGSYSVNFDASNLTSGMYIYRLSGSNVNLTRKMLLMK